MISEAGFQFLILFLGALWAGAQNQLAGGGSFITLPALMLTGMDARTANITSTLALFPGQVAGGWLGRRHAAGTASLGLRALVIISLIGGGIGAVLLLLTPSNLFAQMVPWLVLFATVAFAWGSFFRSGQQASDRSGGVKATTSGLIQLLISVYGGYFGGGIGFLMLAFLTLNHIPMRAAGATKNLLAVMMNLSAVIVLSFFGNVRWPAMIVAALGALAGTYLGARLLNSVNERALRIVVIFIGVTLTAALFQKSY